jgi:hypothetical protein
MWPTDREIACFPAASLEQAKFFFEADGLSK